MTTWADLVAELDRWSTAGRDATFWWRDDDAGEVTPALSDLLELRRRPDVPLALAVIPMVAGRSLAATLATHDGVHVLQHGLAHTNHEPAGQPKSELGRARARRDAASDLAAGRERLLALFGELALPVLAPPWNRIDPAIIDMLPELGFHGVSTFRQRQKEEAAPGVVQINTHIDIIDWRGSRAFCGEAGALAAAVEHLVARRTGAVDAEEPTGLLTHHRMHDAACSTFIAQFAETLSGHPAAQWVSARDIFDVEQWPNTDIAAAQ